MQHKKHLTPPWGILFFLWLLLVLQIVSVANTSRVLPPSLEGVRIFILPIILLTSFVSYVLFSQKGRDFLFTTFLWTGITVLYLSYSYLTAQLSLYPLLSILFGSLLVLLFLDRKTSEILLIIPLVAFFLIGYLIALPLDQLFMGCSFGMAITYMFHLLELRYRYVERITHTFTHEIEYRRQAAHLLFGVGLATLVGFHIVNTFILGIILLCGLLSILYIKSGGNIPLFSKVLLIFERKHHFERFPGRGIFFFVMGSFLSSFFFSTTTTVASILILAFGDSITNIVGKYYGKIPLWFNRKKNIEGPIVAALCAGIAASVVLPLHVALIASCIAMAVETLPIRLLGFEIDDNVTIPLAAGITIAFLMGAV